MAGTSSFSMWVLLTFIAMMTHANITLKIAFLNIHGQSKLDVPRQQQIEHFTSSHNIDILHLQEAHIEPDTFSNCPYIDENFEILFNNNPT
ncbi:MAG: hypothetical protein NZ777_12590, partial [Pseudomonadales bacterium]|nr:hypothetical protein [Pseudomonadales bacterium]